MKLGDFLSTAGTSIPAPTRPVSFKAIGRNSMGQQITSQVRAVFAFVNEPERQEAKRTALQTLRNKYQDKEIPANALSDQEVYEVLRAALRDEDDPRTPFANDTAQLMSALTETTATEIYKEYLLFAAAEFPVSVDDETFKKLVDEAEKSFLKDLLGSYGLATLQRLLPSLAAVYKK